MSNALLSHRSSPVPNLRRTGVLGETFWREGPGLGARRRRRRCLQAGSRSLHPSAPPTRARSRPSAARPKNWAGRGATPPLAAARRRGGRRSPERTHRPDPARLLSLPSSLPPPTLTLLGRHGDQSRPGPAPAPPPPRPPDVGARQQPRAPGWALRSGRDGAEPRAERRRPSSAAPPARPRSSPPCLAAGPSMVMADGPRHLQRGPVRVGFYDIEGTLGKGNFAVVKLGRHRITKTEVRPGVRRERPRLGLGRGAVYRGGRLQRGPGATREAGSRAGKRGPGTVGTREVQGSGGRPRGRGPVTGPECRPIGNSTSRGFALPTPPSVATQNFAQSLPPLAVTGSVASAPEPKFRVFPAFGWGWGGRGSLGAPGLRGERRRQPRGGDRLRPDSRAGAARIPCDPGASSPAP